MFRNVLLLCTLAIVAACSSGPEPDLPEKEYYEKAKAALENNNFVEATKNLEALENRYPFGRYAEQAQLDLIYARYSALDIEGARAAAERFIRLHPQSDNVDYAYYIRGVAAYYTDITLAVRYFPVDAASRDPGQAREAFNNFSELITRFPDSPYAQDAQQRMIAIRNRLALYELNVIRYYVKREAYVAVANRARYIVENLQDTPVMEEALVWLIESYRQLGLEDQADDALVILAASFPDSEAFDENMRFVATKIQRQDRSLTSILNVFPDD